ncbi:CPCC family cysteine-rich protein [Paenibacillus polysaccharolyticus]|uniref:CPCC family cysteine-rich protein n=1 Tax=Paenibacillus polysaccharolyticus TaxID=582692 RepID=UPI0021BE60DA|nr:MULTISPECIES: CPCC family cysteine-rich protein [Paenibacillus]
MAIPHWRKDKGWEICCLCNWEDDGQDDPHADEVWGGPNQDYSLAEARENFKKHYIVNPRGNTTKAGAAVFLYRLYNR